MKRHAITLIGWVSFLGLPNVWADDVDFSKAYVIPNPASSKELRVGGVVVRSGDATTINWMLLGFNPEGLEDKPFFNVLQAGAQASEPELLEQQLRDTVWSGTYQSVNNLYLTELQFKTIQNGLIAGEIVHKTADPEVSNLLRAEVAGNIVTQYLLDVKGDGQLVWVNANEVKYEGFIPPTNIRYLITLTRLRGIEFRHTSSSWGSQSEYRLTLENNKLAGSVGTPADRYGKDEWTGLGLMSLERMPPPSPPVAPILLE